MCSADDLDQAQTLIETGTAAAIATIVARSRGGCGTANCVECGDLIPRRRREMVPNAIRCVECQHVWETSR